MSDMKCPFCQQELVREGSDNYWCKKCNLERHIPALYGSQELWQELIRTRKALDVAVDALDTIDRFLDGVIGINHSEMRVIVKSKLDQIKQITALEQKGE